MCVVPTALWIHNRNRALKVKCASRSNHSLRVNYYVYYVLVGLLIVIIKLLFN